MDRALRSPRCRRGSLVRRSVRYRPSRASGFRHLERQSTREEQMQNPGGLSDRRQENKKEHGDITLGQLDQPGRELLPEEQHPGALHQFAMARIERAA